MSAKKPSRGRPLTGGASRAGVQRQPERFGERKRVHLIADMVVVRAMHPDAHLHFQQAGHELPVDLLERRVCRHGLE